MTSCLSSPARRKRNAREASRIALPNDAKPSKPLLCSLLASHRFLTRRRSTNDDTESEAEQPESEDEAESNPYPLEGKFIDEEDRNRYAATGLIFVDRP